MNEWILALCYIFAMVNGAILGWFLRPERETRRRKADPKARIVKVGKVERYLNADNGKMGVTLSDWVFDAEEINGYSVDELIEISQRKEEFNL